MNKQEQLTYVRVGGDLKNAYNDQIIFELIRTSDLIGAILRLHFCLEEFLNVWCNKVTGVDDFFDIGFIGFDKKISIAQKLGLPDELAAVFKLFNKRRNDFAHDANSTITVDQLNDLRYKIDNIETFAKPVPKCNDNNFMGLNFDGREISWDSEGVTPKDRLVILYLVFALKLINRFDVAFKEKGIPFTYIV